MPYEQIAPGSLPPMDTEGTHIIDLANALAMGSGGHLLIQLARERVVEAHADLLEAQAYWLPSLRIGLGWNQHDGRLQATDGNILQISRNSLFVGGGAGLGGAPLTAGAGGPPRLFVNLSLADALFAPLVAERSLAAASAEEFATVNDALVSIAQAYFDLVEAYGLLANATTGFDAADHLAKLIAGFKDADKASQLEVDRANAELGFWRQAVEDSRRRIKTTSAEIARQLRLDPTTPLVPAEEKVMPIDICNPQTSLDELVATGLATHPELAKYQALAAAKSEQLNQEMWRPWLPNLQVGASAGSFGGRLPTEGTRSDVDLLAVWEMKNLGYGVAALRQQRASQLQQIEYQGEWLRDRIVADITKAASDVTSYRQQINLAKNSVQSAEDTYRRNRNRIDNNIGLPIELLQAIRARATALDSYTKAVSAYNRAQFSLLRAIGRAPDIGAIPPR